MTRIASGMPRRWADTSGWSRVRISRATGIGWGTSRARGRRWSASWSPTIRAYFERIRRDDPRRKKVAPVATAHCLVRVMWALLKRGTAWEADRTPVDEPDAAAPVIAVVYMCHLRSRLICAG